jgi:hypothetical protein
MYILGSHLGLMIVLMTIYDDRSLVVSWRCEKKLDRMMLLIAGAQVGMG